LNRTVILSATAVVSVLLAFLVFGAPDTGGDVPPPPAPTEAPEPVAATENPTFNQPPTMGDEPFTVDDKRARAASRAERLSRPDSVAAARQTVAWTAVRRELLRLSDDDAANLAAAAALLSQRLYEARKAPDNTDFEALAKDQAELLEKIRRYPNIDEGLRGSLDHLATTLQPEP
jgi:hypothetical protein